MVPAGTIGDGGYWSPAGTTGDGGYWFPALAKPKEPLETEEVVCRMLVFERIRF